MKIEKETRDIIFWKEWLKADSLKRPKLIQQLPILEKCIDIENKKLRNETFAGMLNYYFEDLENVICIKDEVEI